MYVEMQVAPGQLRCASLHRFCLHTRYHLPNYPGRIPGNNSKFSYIFSDNTACSHYATSANVDSRKDADIAADPAVFANVDLLAELWSTGTVTDRWIQWVGAREERDVWAHERAGSNTDQARVEED